MIKFEKDPRNEIRKCPCGFYYTFPEGEKNPGRCKVCLAKPQKRKVVK